MLERSLAWSCRDIRLASAIETAVSFTHFHLTNFIGPIDMLWMFPFLCSNYAVLFSQVLEITCGDSKAVYDEVKSRRGHPAIADAAGAKVG